MNGLKHLFQGRFLTQQDTLMPSFTPLFNLCVSFLFFYVLAISRACRILVPEPRIEPVPLQWKCSVLTTDFQGSLNLYVLLSLNFMADLGIQWPRKTVNRLQGIHEHCKPPTKSCLHFAESGRFWGEGPVFLPGFAGKPSWVKTPALHHKLLECRPDHVMLCVPGCSTVPRACEC